MDDLELLVDFLNSADVETGDDELADGAAAGRWLHERALLDGERALDAAELALVRRVRAALRDLAAVHDDHDGQVPPAEAARRFSEVSAALPLRAVADAGGQVWLEPIADGAASALGQLVATVAQAEVAGAWERVKLCAADTCRWAFVDASRNRSRRWCDMGVCGNRQKTRAYRQRARSARST